MVQLVELEHPSAHFTGGICPPLNGPVEAQINNGGTAQITTSGAAPVRCFFRLSASSFKHRRHVLRDIWTHTDGNTNSICDSNSYPNRDTHVYAETNTYTKGSSDSERTANTAPASEVRLNAARNSLEHFVVRRQAGRPRRIGGLSRRSLAKRWEVTLGLCSEQESVCKPNR